MSSLPQNRIFDAPSSPLKCATILLAGGKGTRLHDLTASDSKPAVPFAGRNRIIDFAMANAVRSGIGQMLVATQYAPQTLHDYLPARWGRHFDRSGLILQDGCGRYLGTADALRHNWDRIAQSPSDEVLVLAADHVYDMDYAALVARHRQSGAVATVAVDVVPLAQASAFGVMQADGDGKITSFLEKPAHPPAMHGDPRRALVSMGIYVLSKRWLRTVLFDTHPQAMDFGHDVIPLAVDQGMAAVYKLPAGPDGHTYWRDVGTLDALRLAQLDFVHGSPARLPRAGAVTDWHLGQGSVAMMGAVVSHSADLRNTIVAPGCYVPPGLVAGHDPQEDAAWFTRTPGGTVLITQAMLDRRAVLRIPQSRMRVAPQFGHPHQVRSSLVKDQQHA
ncbi:sugar phosphate nucleotidyltransferase [Paracoccus sediminilitoris]|uniref:sugar phosphate nucleotidyltransferase n=1 Tax=Paracoccus sediminilitoris TaxID=2202419 RepID=UPI00272C726E|nr:sugar phosphate nucleotidyltransferase [Paracoccus sediminilitoris]